MKHSGQQEVKNSIQPTTSERPPKPWGHRGQRATQIQVREDTFRHIMGEDPRPGELAVDFRDRILAEAQARVLERQEVALKTIQELARARCGSCSGVLVALPGKTALTRCKQCRIIWDWSEDPEGQMVSWSIDGAKESDDHRT